MERLYEQMGLTYLSVLAIVFYCGEKSAFVVGAISLCAFISFLVIEKYRKTIYLPVMACVAIIACIVNIMYTNFTYERIVNTYDGKSVEVVATLCEEPQKNNNYYNYYFEAREVNSEYDSFKFVSYHDELLKIEPFDTVLFDVQFKKTDFSHNLSKKCFLIGDFGYQTPDMYVIDSNRTPYYYAIKLRQIIRSSLSNVLSNDTFELCSALLIGDKNLISEEVETDFRRAGASHVIVVSGMHFSILLSGLLLLASRRYRYRKIISAIAIVFLFLYMAVTGFTPSVVRSGVMLFFCFLGVSLSREPYSGNSIGIAAIIVTIVNPYSVGDVGLILSFTTTYTILKLAPLLKEKFCNRIKFFGIPKSNRVKKFILIKLNKAIKGIISVLCMNISAALVSIPLSILFFGSLSSVSVISTFILYLPIQYMLILTFALSILCYIPLLSFLLPVVSFCVEVLAQVSLWIVKFFSQLPFSYIYVKHDYVYLWVLMCLILFLLTMYSKSKIKARVFALSCLLVLASGYLSATFVSYQQSKFYAYDVGNGTAVMYCDKDVNAMLSVDCNNSNSYHLTYDLQKTVHNIDFCACLSDTKNGANCLSLLSKSFAISEVLLYDTERTIDLGKDIKNVTETKENVTVKLSDNATAYYFMVENNYAVYLESKRGSVLVLPKYVDVAEIEEKYRSANTIVVNNCPVNFELLKCDTLIISAESEYAYNMMKYMHSISDRVLLTADADIEMKMEV